MFRRTCVIGALVALTAELVAQDVRRRVPDHRLRNEGARAARTFYIARTGDDTARGISMQAAWRTLERANRASFRPGDRLLLEGGQTFTGTLHVGRDDSGTPAEPVTIESYGDGRAIIDAGVASAIRIENASGIRVRNLALRGSEGSAESSHGVEVVVNVPRDVRLEFIRLDSLDVEGFGGYGVLIRSRSRLAGFKDVEISHVRASHNGLGGIALDARSERSTYAHEHVRIADCDAFGNRGYPGTDRQHTGDGIVVSSVLDGVIERSRAWENGGLSDSSEGGPVGIWAWDSRDVVIQHNESFQNRTHGRWDGGGFDLDGGAQRSTLRCNYSHDNEGAGLLLMQFPWLRDAADDRAEHNVSMNDARKNTYGAIHVFGAIRDLEIVENLVWVSSAPGARPSAVTVQNSREGSPRNVLIRRNVFMSPGVTAIVAEGQPAVRFDSNMFALFRPFARWDGTVYRRQASWTAAIGEAQSQGGIASADIIAACGTDSPAARGARAFDQLSTHK